jgi:hypothetical protein
MTNFILEANKILGRRYLNHMRTLLAILSVLRKEMILCDQSIMGTLFIFWELCGLPHFNEVSC